MNEIHIGYVSKSISIQWVSVEQIAKHLNVKTFTIYKWRERKDMPAHKVGRLWRFKVTEVDEWVINGQANFNKSSLIQSKRINEKEI